MDFYKDMQKIATSVLQSFNQAKFELIKITPGNGPAHNPGEPQELRQTVKGATVRGVSEKYVRLGLATASDMQATIDATSGRPALSDFAEFGGKRYKITRVMAKPAAGTPAVYVLILER